MVIQSKSEEAFMYFVSLTGPVSFYSYLNLILKSCPHRKYFSMGEDAGKQESIMHDDLVLRTK